MEKKRFNENSGTIAASDIDIRGTKYFKYPDQCSQSIVNYATNSGSIIVLKLAIASFAPSVFMAPSPG